MFRCLRLRIRVTRPIIKTRHETPIREKTTPDKTLFCRKDVLTGEPVCVLDVLPVEFTKVVTVWTCPPEVVSYMDVDMDCELEEDWVVEVLSRLF